jgi:simple sugar transport system substrate-binding protein
MIQEGKTLKDGGIPHLVRGGFKEGFLKLTPYGAAVSEAAKTDAEAAKAKFLEGTMIIYKGGLKDNKGQVVIPEGKDLAQTVIGSVGS